MIVVSAFAQISVKAEYIGNSKFYDAVADTNTGDGSATIYSASAMLPLCIQAPDEIPASEILMVNNYENYQKSILSVFLFLTKLLQTCDRR